MSSKSNSVNVGGGLGSLLTALFVYLKLTNQIDWSWWWVTAPTWIPAAIVLSLIAVVGLVFLVATALGGKPYLRRRK